MVNPGFLYQHWKKEQDVFEKNLAVLKKHPDKDAVHDLRVAIKKLRATVELYVILSKEPLWEYPLKETEKLFSISGKQRDIEIAIEVLAAAEKETGKKYTELNRHLLSALTIAIKWTSIAAIRYKKKELAAINFLLKNEIVPGDIINNLIVLINEHLAGCRNYYKQPHKLRQYLKEIYYWIRMAPENSGTINKHEKEIHAILEDLGYWQDLQMFEIKLKHFRKDYLPKVFTEYDLIKELQKKIKEKKQQLLKAALTKTRRIIIKLSSVEKEKSVSA